MPRRRRPIVTEPVALPPDWHPESSPAFLDAMRRLIARADAPPETADTSPPEGKYTDASSAA